MSWQVSYLPEAEKDLESLDGSQRLIVRKAIKKVSQNPLPITEGGYGKPLGNHNQTQLSGLLKIKLKNAGIRIVYKTVKIGNEMIVIVIGARADDEVYLQAQNRLSKNNL